MDRPISIADAREHFDDIVRDVASGETFVVTSDGTPVAKIVPTLTQRKRELSEQARLWKEFGAWLDQRPFRAIGPWTRDDAYD